MLFGVVWRYETPESGEVLKLLASPESLEGVETPDEAKKEGRQVLAEAAPEQKLCLKPLSVVEVTEQMLEILRDCPLVTVPTYDADDENDDNELEFVNVGNTDFWSSQPWWFR